MNRLRVGLLGCGGIAARHAGAVAALGDRMQLVACCGRDPERTQAFADVHGGVAFVDLDRMLDEGIDLLIATLPPFNRHGEIEHAAARGTHLLVEKPIALDEQAADRMVDAAKAAGVVAAIGFHVSVRRMQCDDGASSIPDRSGSMWAAITAMRFMRTGGANARYQAGRLSSRRSIRSTLSGISLASPTACTRDMPTYSIAMCPIMTWKTFPPSSSAGTMGPLRR